MPVGLLVILAQVLSAAHAVRSGRTYPWLYVILFLPAVGTAAYLLAEVLPEVAGGRRAARASEAFRGAVAPLRRYRALREELDVARTAHNLEALAQECLAVGKADEALALYDEAALTPYGDEPRVRVGRARALFDLGRADEATLAFEALRLRHPDYHSAEAHLLYARTLEAAGRRREALLEYDEVVRHAVGAEARYRRAALLLELGETEVAREAVDALARWSARSPRHVRRREAGWVRAAKALRA